MTGAEKIRERRLILLEDHGGVGVVTAGAGGLIDGEPWVNYRTAHVLAQAGRAVIEGFGQDQATRRVPGTLASPSMEREDQ